MTPIWSWKRLSTNPTRLVALLLDPEDEYLRAHDVFISNSGYAQTRINGKHAYLHRLIMGCEKGDGKTVDHINRNKLDNRRENLRIVTKAKNQVNVKRTSNTFGVRGVYPSSCNNKSAYIAQLKKDGKIHHLGSFTTLDDAIKARRAAELKYFGELCPR